MNILGIDHVAVIVRDMDKAVEFFSSLYGLEFEEARFAEQSGIRICCDRPRGDIELFSVVDPSRAADCRPVHKEAMEMAAGGYEGPFQAFFTVENMQEAMEELQRKGIRPTYYVEAAEGQAGWSFLRSFKEVVLNDQDMSLKRIALIERGEKPPAAGHQVKARGIDRVTILVKDIDKTAEYMSRVLDMKFHELQGAIEFGGVRCFVTMPHLDVELVQVVDIAKATSTTLMKHEVELAASGYEGPYEFWLKIDDGREIAAKAEKQGIPVRMLREDQHLSVDPPFEFKEIFFQDENLPVKRAYAMSKHFLSFSSIVKEVAEP